MSNQKNTNEMFDVKVPPSEGFREAVVIVTGAYGFIGSCMVSYLNRQGYENLILVDEFDDESKELNLLHKKYLVRVERENLFDWLQREKPVVSFVFHLGARTDTTEFDYRIHQKLNVEYSQQIWNYCTINNIPLVYASSAATYGNGKLGYEDTHEMPEQLKPLNPYGISKNEFDKWALHQEDHPPFWAGLKFFNVYGPNEYHKGRMASVIFHAYKQILETGKMKLFKSNDSRYKDGEQLRDFIYVKDLVKVMYWMMKAVSSKGSVVNSEPSEVSNYSSSLVEPLTNHHPPLTSGIYNLGTGKARTFNDLVKATFAGMDKKPAIEYKPMPEDLKESYQNFTEANMEKLNNAGYKESFYTLEEGVGDYVRNYLSKNLYY